MNYQKPTKPKKFRKLTFDDMVRSFALKAGSTEYLFPIADILEAFKVAMKNELNVEIEIIQKEIPNREY